MPLGSSLLNVIWRLEQVSRESSEDMTVSRDFGEKYNCMGTSEKAMI